MNIALQTVMAAARQRKPWVLMSLLVIGLVLASQMGIRGGQVQKDARQNLMASVSLWTTGTIAIDGKISNYREPLPIAVTAAHLALFAGIPATASEHDLTQNREYVKRILRVNLLYTLVLLLATWWLVWLLVKSHAAAAVTVVLTWASVVMLSNDVDQLYTELVAAALFTKAAALAVWLYQSKRTVVALLTGLAFGLLALTKASTFYISIIAIPLLAFAMAAFGLVKLPRAVTILLALCIGFGATVTPWLLRNSYYIGQFSISERGGQVLLARAVKNSMTDEEFIGSFYVYSRHPGRRVLEFLFGFDPRDLEPGGRYVRLIRYQPGDREAIAAKDPTQATSYHAKARAMRSGWRRDVGGVRADAYTREQAVKLILAEPWKHARATVSFAYRGLWTSAGPLTFLSPIAILALLVSPFVSIVARRPEWFAFSLLGVGIFCFHALATHFIARYSAPILPLAYVALAVYAIEIVKRHQSDRFSSPTASQE